MSHMEGKVIRLTIKLIMNLTVLLIKPNQFDLPDKDL